MDLAEFLIARIAEDEAVARAVLAEHAMYDWDSYMSSAGWYGGSAHKFAQRNDPARVLAECEAKQRIVELASWSGPKTNLRDALFGPAADVAFRHGIAAAMRLLAWPYRDHPDYDPAWAVEATATA